MYMMKALFFNLCVVLCDGNIMTVFCCDRNTKDRLWNEVIKCRVQNVNKCKKKKILGIKYGSQRSRIERGYSRTLLTLTQEELTL